MKTPALITLILLAAISALNAQPQPPDTLWTKTFGGSEWEEGFCVQQTNDGGYIIVGYSNTFGYGGDNVYLVKTDFQGNQLWYRTFGGAYNDRGFDVKQTPDNGFIIVGRTNAVWDVYLIKTNNNGYSQWTRTFGGNGSDIGYSVQLTMDGGYIIAGETASFGAGSVDVYLIKTDGNGYQQWYNTFGGISADEGWSVQQTTDGGYIIAGCTASFGAGSFDVYLIKTDESGNQQWDQTYGGISADFGKSMQQTADGGCVIAGWTSSFGAGSRDVYLIKTDVYGNQQWSQTFGGTGFDYGNHVHQTSDSGYIITGHIDSLGISHNDVYVVKTDNDGNQLWYKTIGGSSFEVGTSVQQTSDGGYIITGSTASYGAGGYDVYLIKLESEIEQLFLTLTPINPPIQIPSGGGSFQFTFNINNLGLGAVVFDKWCDVLVPGMPYPMKIQVSEQNYLSTGGNINRTLTQYVPAIAPAGTYTYRGFVGEYPDFIADCDSFTFEKTGDNGGFDWRLGWMIDGWEVEQPAMSLESSPTHFSLISAYPNPFNAKTAISYRLTVDSFVELLIYDITGREVACLSEGYQTAGLYEVVFDASQHPSGVYFARLQAQNFSQTRKLILLK